MYWMVARSFGAELTDVLGVAASLLTTGVANLATLIPSSPGYVGPFETGVALVVDGALGVRPELALSYAILLHAALYFPITLIGLAEWWRQHLSIAKVRTLADDPTAEIPRDEEGTEATASRRARRPLQDREALGK